MIGILLCFPAIIFFISKVTVVPETVLTPLPIIMASFLFVEGLSSFFIGT